MVRIDVDKIPIIMMAVIITFLLAIAVINICSDDDTIYRCEYKSVDYDYYIEQTSKNHGTIVFEAQNEGRLYITHDNELWDEIEYKKGLNEFKVVFFKDDIESPYHFMDRVYYKWNPS